MKIVAHRGVSSLWPENSLIAFRKAVELDVDVIECDIHRTRDGHLVLIHDYSLDRTTTGHGLVREMGLSEIHGCRLRGLEAGREGLTERDLLVPRLEDLLQLIAPTGIELRLEVKEAGIESDVLRVVSDWEVRDRSVVISFFPEVLREIKALDRGMRTSLLTFVLGEQDYREVRPFIDGVDANVITAAEEAFVRQIKRDRLTLDFWTVNTREHYEKAAAYRPDYLTSDFPQLMMRLAGRLASDAPE